MVNRALIINPPPGTFTTTTRGSNFAWAWFAAFSLGLLLLIGSMFAVRRSQRMFHRIAVLICFIYLIYYFIVASDLGSTPIGVEFRKQTSLTRGFDSFGNPTRQIWYVRWVSYTLIFPLIIFMLLLATGRPVSEYIATVFFAIVWGVSFLIGALVRSSYKWGFFTFGLFGMLCAIYELLVPGARSAGRLGTDYRKPYLIPAAILSFLWLIYPIAWGLAEGGNVIRVTSDIIWYGILDLLVFIFVVGVFLGLVDSVDHANYHSHRWGDAETEPVWGEKAGRHSTATTGATPRASEAGVGHNISAAPASGAGTGNAPVTGGVGHSAPVAPALEGGQTVAR